MKQNILNAVTIRTAPAESPPILKKIQKTFGFIRNLMATLANSPTVLNGYLAMDAVREKGTLVLSGLIVAIAFPVILNAASLPWNPNEIAKGNGIVVLAKETAKPAPKARLNVDSNGVILKGYDPVAYFTRHQAVKGDPAIQTRFRGAIFYFVSVARTKSRLARILPDMFRNMEVSALITCAKAK